jgi:hypothetical protein
MALIPLRARATGGARTRGKLTLTRKRSADSVTPFNLVDEQFPEFIRSDYSGMVNFAKKYFLYLSQTENGKIQDIKDIDKTTGDYIIKLRKEFSYNSAKFNFLSDVEFIRTAKLFYSSKGTEESIRFLFRVMFNEDVDVEYPSENIFAPSTARWFQLKSIKIRLLPGSIPPDEFKGSFLTLRNSTGEKQIITVYDIKDITEKVTDNEPSFLYEVFFQDELFINVQIEDVLEGNEFQAEIIPSLTKVVVVNQGQRFRYGQVIQLTSDISGSGAVGIVSAVTATGGIRAIKILRFGLNYETPFYISVSTAGAFTDAGFSFETTGDADIVRGLQDYTTGYEESIDVFRGDYVLNDSPEGDNSFYVLNYFSGQFVSQVKTRQFFFTEEDNSALLLCLVGPIATYPGSYLDRRGMASDASKLQDNNYYQNFSYVVRSKQDVSQYRDVVESFAHPAGMKLFADKSVEDFFALEPLIVSVSSTTHIDVPVGNLSARADVTVRADIVPELTNSLEAPVINKGGTTAVATISLDKNLGTSIEDFNTFIGFAQSTLNTITNISAVNTVNVTTNSNLRVL